MLLEPVFEGLQEDTFNFAIDIDEGELVVSFTLRLLLPQEKIFRYSIEFAGRVQGTENAIRNSSEGNISNSRLEINPLVLFYAEVSSFVDCLLEFSQNNKMINILKTFDVKREVICIYYHEFKGVTIYGVWSDALDLLTTHTHQLELQALTTL
jgi:hypothetical protein